MGLIRRSRTTRPDEHEGRVTPRDAAILEMVGRQKVATTDQIAHLHFGDRSTASRRLARLQGMGLLRVHVPEQNGPNYYSLSKTALAYLVREGVEAESLHVGRPPAREHLEHLRALGDFHALLAAEVALRPGVALDLVLFEHDLRRLSGSPPPPYLPDLIVRLARQGTAIGYAVELDLGGEGAEFFARSKVRETVALARARRPLFGLDRWRPLLVAPTTTRLRSLATATAAEGGGVLWLGTEFDVLRERGALGAAFATAATIAATPRGAALTFTESLISSRG